MKNALQLLKEYMNFTAIFKKARDFNARVYTALVYALLDCSTVVTSVQH